MPPGLAGAAGGAGRSGSAPAPAGLQHAGSPSSTTHALLRSRRQHGHPRAPGQSARAAVAAPPRPSPSPQQRGFTPISHANTIAQQQGPQQQPTTETNAPAPSPAPPHSPPEPHLHVPPVLGRAYELEPEQARRWHDGTYVRHALRTALLGPTTLHRSRGPAPVAEAGRNWLHLLQLYWPTLSLDECAVSVRCSALSFSVFVRHRAHAGRALLSTSAYASRGYAAGGLGGPACLPRDHLAAAAAAAPAACLGQRWRGGGTGTARAAAAAAAAA